MPHPTPPTPHVGGGAGRGGGARGVGGVGWGIGGVGYEKNIVYIIDTSTHVGTKITVGKKLEILRFHFRFNRFGKFYRQIECQAGVQLIK